MSVTTTSFYVIGGTLPPGTPSYVERQADRELFDGLKHGEFCYVLHARQMGKSSLMVRTAARLREEGVAVVVLDLTALGRNLTVEQWYDGLLGRVGRQLDLEEELNKYSTGIRPGSRASRLPERVRQELRSGRGTYRSSRGKRCGSRRSGRAGA